MCRGQRTGDYGSLSDFDLYAGAGGKILYGCKFTEIQKNLLLKYFNNKFLISLKKYDNMELKKRRL